MRAALPAPSANIKTTGRHRLTGQRATIIKALVAAAEADPAEALSEGPAAVLEEAAAEAGAPRRRDALAAAPGTDRTARRTAAARPAAAVRLKEAADTSAAVCTEVEAVAEAALPPLSSGVNADLFERVTCRGAQPALARARVLALALTRL